MSDDRLSAEEIEALVRAASAGDEDKPGEDPEPQPVPPEEPKVAVHPVSFPPVEAAVDPGVEPRKIAFLLDVPLEMTVELGRSEKTIREILALGPGSVVELDKSAGEPVDILVNGRKVARGEVVVIDESFGIRIVEIDSPADRLDSLR